VVIGGRASRAAIEKAQRRSMPFFFPPVLRLIKRKLLYVASVEFRNWGHRHRQ